MDNSRVIEVKSYLQISDNNKFKNNTLSQFKAKINLLKDENISEYGYIIHTSIKSYFDNPEQIIPKLLELKAIVGDVKIDFYILHIDQSKDKIENAYANFMRTTIELNKNFKEILI